MNPFFDASPVVRAENEGTGTAPGIVVWARFLDNWLQESAILLRKAVVREKGQHIDSRASCAPPAIST